MSDLKQLLTEYVRTNTPDGPPPPLATSGPVVPHARRDTRKVWLAAAAVLAVVAGAATLLLPGRSADVAELTVLATGGAGDHLPSTTAADWVTYADHVVVATPVDERVEPPTAAEVDRGEGLVGRTVTLRVDDVLWSRGDPDRPAPQTMSWDAWGWTFEGEPDNRGRVVGEGTPRVELGHTYLLAIVWEEARCSPGDPRQPAGWQGLGAASTVPFDGGVVGRGEYEGRVRTLEEARADVRPGDPNLSFGQELVGGSAGDVRRALDRAVPGTPEEFTPPAPCE
jgi:hypothetical protein